jgi:hypothetical protein
MKLKTMTVLFFALGVAVSSQQPQSVEELYLSSAITIETLAAQMQSTERAVQFLALSTLDHQLETGYVAVDNGAVLDALKPLVEQGVLVVSRNSSRSIEIYDPGVRREAVRLVGKLDTSSARSTLVQTVRHDPEPTVRAEALFGLARMKSDPDGDVTRSIARMILREHVQQFDEGVVYAAITAIGAIARESDNTVDPASREMLIYIASDYRYPRILREMALDVLSSL